MKLEELINQYYNTLKPNDLYIWKYIATHKSECKILQLMNLPINVIHLVPVF